MAGRARRGRRGGEAEVDAMFTSRQVVELTGVTPRQLQWLDERGIIVPAREGHRRLYSFQDLAEIAVIGELRRRGFSLQRVRKVMRFLQKELGQRLVETVEGAKYHLLTDGKHIFLEDSERGVIDVLKNSRQPLLAVCLSDAVEGIRADVRGLRKRSGSAPGTERPSRQHKAPASPVRHARRRGPETRSAYRRASAAAQSVAVGV